MENPALVGIVMGSRTDLPTMQAAADVLAQLQVPFELTIVSAHRTPRRMLQYAETAEARGLRVLVAGAGGAAHLPGMLASLTPLPVVGVPVLSRNSLQGLDSLLSIVQMPGGIPVATVAVNGAQNAGLLAARILGVADAELRSRLRAFAQQLEQDVMQSVDATANDGFGMVRF